MKWTKIVRNNNIIFAEINLCFLVLAEEVRDLKICLQSADKELVELKSQQIKERNEEVNKRDQLYQKVCPCEI